MADPTVVQFPPSQPPKKDFTDVFLADRLKEIADHLNECSTMLYECQDEAFEAGIQPVVIGVEMLIGFYADRLEAIAGKLNPENKEENQEGGEDHGNFNIVC